jgi:capsular exopolysaccharide synthesis family protein
MRIQSSHCDEPYRGNVEPIDPPTNRVGERSPIDPMAEGNAGRIGDLLIAAGMLLPDQADSIERAQRASGQRFGETAVALGLTSQDSVNAALASQFNFSVAAPGASQLDPSLIAARGQRDRASELVRSLRANLSHVLADWPDGCSPAVTVASLTSAVGRRVIASNLAIASAQAGVRTLLIDADMRNPALHRLFNVNDSAGLSSLLAGRHAVAPLQSIESIPGLSFLPAGPVPPNPAELLARLAALLPKLRAESGASLILLNAPPLDLADDLYIVAAAAPAVLMVTRRHFTLARPLVAATARLQLAGATIIGSVLNVG